MTLREHLVQIASELAAMREQVNARLDRQDENLKEHMRRSLANEKAVEILADAFEPVDHEFKQRQAFKRRVQKLAWGLAGTVLAALLIKLLVA